MSYRKCEWCGNHFKPLTLFWGLYVDTDEDSYFCSNRCYYEYQNQDRNNEQHKDLLNALYEDRYNNEASEEQEYDELTQEISQLKDANERILKELKKKNTPTVKNQETSKTNPSGNNRKFRNNKNLSELDKLKILLEEKAISNEHYQILKREIELNKLEELFKTNAITKEQFDLLLKSLDDTPNKT